MDIQCHNFIAYLNFHVCITNLCTEIYIIKPVYDIANIINS